MQTYCLIVGVILLLLSIVLLIRRLWVVFYGVSTTGRVIGHETRTFDDSTHYLAKIEFFDANGILRQFTTVAGGADRQPGVGADVPVRFLPSKPSWVYMDSFLHLWAAPLACAMLGFAALYAAIPEQIKMIVSHWV